ncbi:hypothetical protein [Tsukamurella strandjordii]|uniref:Uncharacterized protein n=1 Tax=Tsukamurella strandjordii TaxID=147577 RepID=A0AA90NA66_9ACTN|nr:hypothetical protein [Tsukamurella strandjordii]MDP0398536.1 hypothetical protein [Tsukamurella strandjordii]
MMTEDQTRAWLELTRPHPDALVQLSSMRQPGRVWTDRVGVYRDIEQASQVAHGRDEDGENVYFTWLMSDAPRTIDNALTRTVHADLDRVANKAAPEDIARRGRLTKRNKDWLWLLERAATIPGLVLVRTGAYNLQAHVFIEDGTMDMRDYQDLCRGLGEALADMPSGRVEPDPKVQPNDALRLVGTRRSVSSAARGFDAQSQGWVRGSRGCRIPILDPRNHAEGAW